MTWPVADGSRGLGGAARGVRSAAVPHVSVSFVPVLLLLCGAQCDIVVKRRCSSDRRPDSRQSFAAR